MTNENNGIARADHAALCPQCARPHHFVEIKFPIDNDSGYWEIECSKCRKVFVIEVNNPRESGGKLRKQIRAWHEEPFAGDRALVAGAVIRHNINLNLNEWAFNYEAAPLYQCAKNSADLDDLAKSALDANIKEVVGAYRNAQNYLMSAGPEHDFAVVHLPLICKCGGAHTATFYMRLLMDPDKGPRSANDFLLADVSGAMLGQTLDGIVSKDDAMELFEKLIIRWNLLADQILIVSPFVGTTYTSLDKQLEIWQWLLKILDPAKAVFLTRGATWSAYKKAMEDSGVSVELLEKFGLENTLVAMDVRKQQFHAKFFAGISEAGCEVMSGSANLVRGPSLENISFRQLEHAKFDERYLTRMKLKKPLPLPKKSSKHWVLIDRGPSGWRSGSKFDKPYIEVSAQAPAPAPEIGRDNPISIDAAQKIRDNAIDFLNGGLELLFDDDLSSRTAKLAVISIQAAVELLAKYRLVRELGLSSIVEGELPLGRVEQAAKEGKFKTIGFNETLKLIGKREALQKFEKVLINELVTLRNALVHFSSEVDPEEVKQTCAHILASVLAMFALGEERDSGEMEDYSRFLHRNNFNELINFGPYRAQAVKTAQESPDNEKIVKCYQCENDSFSLRVAESFLCHCCGLGVVQDAIGFADCDACGAKLGVFYDPLNLNNEMHHGKCMHCKTTQWVWVCEGCDSVVSQSEGRKRCECPEC